MPSSSSRLVAALVPSAGGAGRALVFARALPAIAADRHAGVESRADRAARYRRARGHRSPRSSCRVVGAGAARAGAAVAAARRGARRLSAVLYLLFLLTWGLNYRRVPLEQKLGFRSRERGEPGRGDRGWRRWRSRQVNARRMRAAHAQATARRQSLRRQRSSRRLGASRRAMAGARSARCSGITSDMPPSTG